MSHAKIIRLLNDNLADAIHFNTQCKVAHWNVSGPDFLQFHELFDKIYVVSGEWPDLIAERIAQLDGIAKANLNSIVENTSLKSYDERVTDGMEHTKLLSQHLRKFLEGVKRTSKTVDEDTRDMLGEISRSVEKYLWFLESYLK